MKKYLLLLALFAVPVHAEEVPTIDTGEVIQYTDDVVGWYRNLPILDGLAQNARETALRDSVRQSGDKIVRLSLDYAKAQNAVQLTPTAPGQAPVEQPAGGAPNIVKATADNAAKIATLQNQLVTLNRDVKRAGGSQRRMLVAKRDKTQSELNLAIAQRDLLTTVAKFFAADKSDDTADGLPGKIAELTKLVPDVEASQQKSSSKVVVEAAKTENKEQKAPDNGIFTLFGNALDSWNKRGYLRDIISRTDAMHAANQDHISTLRAGLRAAIARGNELGAQTNITDPAMIAAQQQELNTLVVRFKVLSAAIAPLAEQSIWIESAQRNLHNWAKVLDDNVTTTLRDLVLRMTLLAFAILIPLVISQIAHRATVKYVKDERRQRQLRALRRILLSFIIIVIVCLNFFSEFGSIATYAGLLTAGLAVALQNVILSLVAHFFFFGRFGVRVGDRVTVNGVTGDIIEIGLLRFYLMELDDDSSRPHPTGRVVAFPNSILFQQSAFYKQIPGTHYTWRAVTVSLPSGIDYAKAQEKLLGAINGVYAGYRTDMETQQSILESSTRLKVRLPQPEGNLKFAGSGMAFEARYPVEMGRTAEIDDRVAQSLSAAMRSDTELRPAAEELPQIKPAS